jgi:hypothetical protein
MASRLHPKERVELKKKAGYCLECQRKMKEQHKDKTIHQLRNMGLVRNIKFGCAQCRRRKGAVICSKCWPEYSHDL